MRRNRFVGGWKMNREGPEVMGNKRFHEKEQVCVGGWKRNREGTGVKVN